MTTLPADEDYARALMTIFALDGVRAGQSLPAATLPRLFGDRNFGAAADYDAALAYAIGRGWVAIALNRIRLTAEGFAEL
jgi:hypothetical protein